MKNFKKSNSERNIQNAFSRKQVKHRAAIVLANGYARVRMYWFAIRYSQFVIPNILWCQLRHLSKNSEILYLRKCQPAPNLWSFFVSCIVSRLQGVQNRFVHITSLNLANSIWVSSIFFLVVFFVLFIWSKRFTWKTINARMHFFSVLKVNWKKTKDCAGNS